MTWQQIEKIFNRALSHCFSKRKWFLVFSVLVLCGLISVICRAISHGSTQWIQMSLTFLPVFFSGGFLVGVGIVLTRIYHDEVKQRPVQYIKVIKGAKELFIGITYMAVPLIFAYLVLWMFLGVFYLLRSIPVMGEFIHSILSFGPFLLVLGSLILSLIMLAVLFFLTPAAALRSDLRLELAEEVLSDCKSNPFLSFVLPIVGMIPILFVAGFLSLAAVVTQIMYIDSGHGLSIVLKWFFIMIPFCAFLTPAVIFFFNFAAESYVLIRKQQPTAE